MTERTARPVTPADWRQGRLTVPLTPEQGPRAPRWSGGLHHTDHGTGLLYVPAQRIRHLVVVLHGAGGGPEDALRWFAGRAEDHDLLLYAPRAAGPTWDLLLGGYGPDVAGIAEALADLVPSYRPERLAIAGFSDGASYALSLGLTNGDLFSTVLGFSPGFMAPSSRNGVPRVFVSHGTADRVLPVSRCARPVVAQLEMGGYPVRYHEFTGGHVVPPDVRAAALELLVRA